MRHPEADSVALDLRSTMSDVFAPRDIRRGSDGLTWEFYGHLTSEASHALAALQAPFSRLGFLPFLHHDGDQDVVIAIPAARLLPSPARWGLHLFLLLLTLATLTLTGALLRLVVGGPRAVTLGVLLDALEQHGREGLTFAGVLLLILGAHELGHYVVARRAGMLITLPFFIPAPPPPYGLGTLGALIAMRSPVRDRRSLFDVALAGPLAGLVVAVPALVVGLLQAGITSLPVPLTPPFIAAVLARGLRGPLPIDLQVDWFHPVLFAAWLGLMVTSINLLPMGQLDGGHLVYAALGRRAVWVARLAWLGLLGLTLQAPTWGLYALILLVTGLGHPPPQDDITPLDRRRRWWALVALVLLLLTFSPRPIP